MHLLITLAAAVLAGGTLCCQGHSAALAVASSTTPAAMSPTAATPPAAPRYDVRGIFDPELGGIMAFALKVPHGWLMQQSLTRQYDRGMHAVKIYLSLTSPDKQQTITVLPEMTYVFNDSPEARRVRASMPQLGQNDPTTLGALLPVEYLKRVVLPLLNRQPATRLRLTAEHGDPPKDLGHGTQHATGYVEGVLPSGRNMRFETEVTLATTNYGSGGSATNWNAVTNVVESTTNLAATVAMGKELSKSLVPNPAWLKKEGELRQRGIQQNIAQSGEAMRQMQAEAAAQRNSLMQRFHQNEANFQAQRNVINQNFQRHMRAGSQVASATADYLGDQTLYQNPTSGERLKVQGSLGHVYQDAQGTVLNSNQPLSPGSVNWQELQQVELRNY